MTKRSKKNNDARDTNFIACFLIHGAKPSGPSQALSHYKDDVRNWWLVMNQDMDPPIKNSTAYKFWNRYHRWYENMMTNERRTERAAGEIVKGWLPKPGECCPNCHEITCECSYENI